MSRPSRKKVTKTVSYKKETSGKLELPQIEELVEKPKVFKKVSGRTPKQKDLIKSINSKDITLVSGVAGTGKTLISVGMSIEHLEKGKIEKIIITRPMVTAEEEMGFLPGGMDEKIHPFLIPIYDSFREFVPQKQLEDWKKEGVVEIVPLAFMRGRTLKKAFIVADELQNATLSQLKMLITRIGEDSKMVLNGDPTQSDLPYIQRGAFQCFCDRLIKYEEVGVVYLTGADIQRHKLLTKIIPDLETIQQKDMIHDGQRTQLENERPPRSLEQTFSGYHDYDTYFDEEDDY